MDAVTLVAAALLYLGGSVTIGYVSRRVSIAGYSRVRTLSGLFVVGLVLGVPAIAFDRLAVPALLGGASSPLLLAAVYTVGVTVTTLAGVVAYRFGDRLGHDGSDADAAPHRAPRTLTAIGIAIYTALVGAVALARGGFLSPLAVPTLVVVGIVLFLALQGDRPTADGYRAPTDAETRRIEGCFDTFDGSPGTIVVYSVADTDTPKAPGVLVAAGLGERSTYVHEALLDVATDDELAVAFAQASYRSPFTYAFRVAFGSIGLLFVVYVLLLLNTLTLWAFDVGLATFGGPALPLVVTASSLLATVVAIEKLSRWSFAAADDFACRHLGTTTVRRTYRALGDALVVDTEIDHDDRAASDVMEPPLVQRLDRLGSKRAVEGSLEAVTGWVVAGTGALMLWVVNLLVRPAVVVTARLAATPPAWLVGVGSAALGLALAAVPLLVVARRRGPLLDGLPAAARSELNTRWEFPLVVVGSLFVTDLVVNGSLSLFWLCLAGLALFATGLSYRSRYYPHLNSHVGASAANAARLRACLDPDDSVDGIRIYETLNQYDIFVTGDDTYRTLHVERSVLEIDDDAHLAVALAEASERERQLRGSGRLLFFMFALCPLGLVYGVVLFAGGRGIGAGLIVASLLLLVVLLFFVRLTASRFFRIDRRLCERYGSETVRAAYDSVGPHIAHEKAAGFAWRVWLSPYPSIASRVARLPESDGPESAAEPVSA